MDDDNPGTKYVVEPFLILYDLRVKCVADIRTPISLIKNQ